MVVSRRRAPSASLTDGATIQKDRCIEEHQQRSPRAAGYLGRSVMSTYLVLFLAVVMVLPSAVEMKFLGPKLSRLVMDEKTGIVYVGGENRLYQLDEDLKLLVQVKTGPKADSDKCFPPPTHCYVNRTATNNFNKVLVVDSGKRQLIACGSVYQGMCEARDLINISLVLDGVGGTSETDIKNFAVVANDEKSSSEAFIAPGPPSRGMVLYVATTYSGKSPESGVYREQVPAIATRNLNSGDRFSLTEVQDSFSEDRSSAIFIKSEVAPQYPIRYVTGFRSAEYNYFLTVQRDTVSRLQHGRLITKIVQFCEDDPFYYSYADIPLKCTGIGKYGTELDYNVLQAARVIMPGEHLAKELFTTEIPGDILVGAFTRDTTEGESSFGAGSKRRRSGPGKVDTDSAICVFTMAEIRRKFLENIKLCHQGNSSVSGGGYLRVGPRGNCNQQSGLITNNIENENEYMCNTNKLESFSNIVGLNPVVKRSIISYKGVGLTALALTVVNNHTVAFLGTDDGRLKKVVLRQGDEGALEYGEEVISAEGDAILPDLHYYSRYRMLYALTSTNVTRLSMENCSSKTACDVCLKDRDPFCGWCHLENKCGMKDSCLKSQTATSLRWLQDDVSKCIYIPYIYPSSVSVNKDQVLRMSIEPSVDLPLEADYSCVFKELNWVSPAKPTFLGARCKTSKFQKLGLTLGSLPYKTVTLALNSSETGKMFVTTTIDFYNCSNFKSCTSCTNSNYPCNWCVQDNGCYDDISECQANIIHHKKSKTHSVKGGDYCPQLDTSDTSEIYLPVGVKKQVILKGSNIPELEPKFKNYECVLEFNSRRLTAPAHRHDDKSITCHIPPINYDENQGSFVANLSVYWGDNFWLESNLPIKATIYKCDVLANNECSLCVNLNYTQHYLGCYWCQGSCQYSSSCGRHTSVTTCPAPVIKSVWPLSGPIQGGTNVTIEGSNLGTKFEDIETSIMVANVLCEPFRSLYLPSKRVVCQTKWRDQEASGPVVITVNKRSGQFHRYFSYKSPRIEDIMPKIGPRSGGSVVTIKGRDMDTGGVHRVSIGGAECDVIRERTTNSSMQCVTSKVYLPKARHPITIFFDEQSYQLNRVFTYKADPVVTGITPLESILAGGRILTVIGKGFSTIQQPKMFAYIPTITSDFYRTNTTICKVINNEVMKCPTPPLVDSLKNIIRSRRSTPGSMSYLVQEENAHASSTVQHVQVVELAFHMDDVPTVQNLTGTPKLDNRLKYYPNPRVHNFTENGGVKVLKGDSLIIEGENLNVAAKQSEMSVMIGQSPCNVTTFSQSQIVCKLPTAQPAGETTPGGEKDRETPPWVKVKINNLEFYVGRIEYDVPQTYSFPREAIAGICVGGGILLLIIILILIIYRRQNTKAERIYRKLQIQLDSLESNVRNECKQAFAELQTDMTDLTGDLISSGIPFWDFHSYVFKVLFPGMSDHIILHPPIQKNGRFQFSDHGLQLFHQLLGKKLFMTTFIKTLEAQRSFSIRDRANVASLLMIVYLNNMEYATEILKCLLVDLVKKSVEDRHPKLMLRRSESVVEKLLTNWLSVCLYDYLRDYAGASLFMLYKAIKLQAEKGPVDCVTGDARYSLSEDTLLREKIEARILTLNIESGSGEIVQVRVPDCDTISQTKEKILDHLYKNIPFSQRPLVKDLELEWRNGPTGPLLLNNLDIESYNKDGWRRLNTLALYRVHDGAYMSLLHRQNTLKSMNGSLDNSVLSIGSVSPILKKDEESGFKEWHLVKHDDTLIKDGAVKMISEIFLTRLLSTKGTLQKYIDDFFRNMLSASPFVPPVVKYLFDFLDHEAEAHGITDHEVVHTWKCNSLPLRFWVNIIKNPDFVFDINKPRIVDSCLSVVAQTFMDSCSTSEHRLGKDSPSNKLLFAKDIAQYRKLVEKFFTDVREIPALSEQEMNAFLAKISRTSPKLFYISSALGELYKYVSKYKSELMDVLEQDNQARALQLSSKLGHVVTCMEGPSGNMAYV